MIYCRFLYSVIYNNTLAGETVSLRLGGLLGFVVFEGVPALGAEGYLGVVAGNHGAAELGARDVADDVDAFDFLDFLVIGERHGEQKLVVLAAVERGRHEIHIELLGHRGGLIVDGDAVLVDAASAVTLRADVYQL